MATNAKVTVEDVKKAAAEAAKTVEKVATEAKKETAKAASAAKKTATKKATDAKKTATKAVAKAKKEVVKTAVVQYQGIEFTMEDAIKKAEEGFKNDYKKKTIEEINVYVKPEERKIYYVVNGDCVGSVDL